MMANIPVQVPADFRYYTAYCKGRPQHDRLDPFLLRHPSMKCSRRAKIFSPFDALRGFRDTLSDAEKGLVSR